MTTPESHPTRNPSILNATTARLADETNIPGTNKSWSQTAMSREMEVLESRDDAVEYHKNSKAHVEEVEQM
ncbi:MAG: hypothetical protein L6R35_000462 [Caloplaca aegaea]|nr:MAG: hypothetical protein L6R35_000462 [Caloplaca aegaea]